MYMIPKSSPPTTCAGIEEEGATDHLKPKSSASQNRLKFIYRALGKIPTIASAVYRHRLGRNYNSPMPYSLNYCENILYMMDRLNEPNYVPDARLVKIRENDDKMGKRVKSWVMKRFFTASHQQNVADALMQGVKDLNVKSMSGVESATSDPNPNPEISQSQTSSSSLTSRGKANVDLMAGSKHSRVRLQPRIPKKVHSKNNVYVLGLIYDP